MTRLSSSNGSEKNNRQRPRNCFMGDCGMCQGFHCNCNPRCQSNQECIKMESGFQCRPHPSTTALTTNTTATIECETAQGAYKEAQKLNEG